jgi:hypothetical protein
MEVTLLEDMPVVDQYSITCLSLAQLISGNDPRVKFKESSALILPTKWL